MLDRPEVAEMTARKPHPIDVMIGQNLRRIRTGRGISQEKLGYLMNLTFQQIQKYEKGTNRIGGSRMARLAAVLEVDVSLLFAGTGSGNVEFRPLDERIINISSKGIELAHMHDAIIDPEQKLALRNMARTMAKGED